MVWGLLPVLLSSRGFSLTEVGLVTAVYPGVWGLGQLFTGRLSDFVSRKVLLFWGMLLQGITLLLLAEAAALHQFIILAAFLGLGTALVYPTFLVAISENTNPGQRAESLGVFRLWRDLGYAFGAVITGVLVEFYGLLVPVVFIGGLTLLSAMVIKYRMVALPKVRLLDG